MPSGRYGDRDRRRRGVTMIEGLVAALILAVSLMGLMNAWLFSFGLTQKTDEIADAYNIARAEVERIRALGFDYMPPDSIAVPIASQQYNGSAVPVTSGGYYRAQVAVLREEPVSGMPDQLRMRAVEVEVRRISDSQVLFRTQTYLVLGGI